MNPTVNPLQRFFRQPVIYVRLPSAGQFWPDNSINLPQNQELPVLAMTAADEITYRTPDALFNGQAVVDVIQSCVPNIQDAWQVPSMDLYSLLIAIRIASYGHNMDVSSTCPKCASIGDYTMDLRQILDSIGRPDYGQHLQSNDLTVMFRPLSFTQQNQINLRQFENQKRISAANEAKDLPDDQRVQLMSDIMKAITDMTVSALANSIQAIRTPDSLVTESAFITEFLQQCDRNTFETVKNAVMDLRKQSEARPVQITCDSCKHVYEQNIDLEMSSFFVTAS